MRAMIVAVLLQVLTAPDPSQMEKAPDLGYVPTPHSFNLPNGLGWGAPSGVAMNSKGHILVFNRGAFHDPRPHGGDLCCGHGECEPTEICKEMTPEPASKIRMMMLSGST